MNWLSVCKRGPSLPQLTHYQYLTKHNKIILPIQKKLIHQYHLSYPLSSMKAVVINALGGADVLKVTELPIPTAEPSMLEWNNYKTHKFFF